MYPAKRLDYLLEASRHIKSVHSEFEILFLGAGPDERVVREATQASSWIHYVGPLSGEARAPYFRMAKLLLMPGVVGLAALDAFAAGLPLVTTDVPGHGPEIAYLDDGGNGVIVKGNPTPKEYASAVLGLLADEEKIQALSMGAALSAARYTIDAMIDRFAEGVVMALEAAKHR
jgi:glycosyltransferase involved in cell wall biosynthesis